MTDQVQILDPEIEELLRDIAQDPDSTLLSVERPAEFRSLSLKRGEVSSRSLDWTSPERKLLDSYREQVAFLLRYQCYVGYKNEERFAALRPFRTETAFRGIAQDSGQIRKEAAKEGACLEAEFSGDSAAALIQNCVGLVRDPAVSRMRLAAASLRLVPTDVGRQYMGLEYAVAGQMRSARAAFDSLIQDSCAPTRMGSTLCHLGTVLAKMGRLEDARRAYSAAGAAGATGPPKIDSHIFLLQLSARMGDRPGLLSVAADIEAWDIGPALAGAWRDILSAQAAGGNAEASATARTLVAACQDQLGPSSKVILNAVQ